MCAGMATVLNVKRIVWLTDDLWGGASATYNKDSPYIKSRFPTMGKADFEDLQAESIHMWIEYLIKTGHSDAIKYMLGVDNV